MSRIIPIVTAALLLATTGTHAAAPDTCPTLESSQRPALLYSENEYGIGLNHLILAYQQDGAWQREEIAADVYLAVHPLEGDKLLLSIGPSARDCSHHAMDLAAGKVTQLTARTGACPFRFERKHERFRLNTAGDAAFMAIDSGAHITLEFLRLDCRTMAVESRALPKDLFPRPFDNGTRLRIAPGGKHIAFLKLTTPPKDSSMTFRYILRVLRIEDLSITDLDNEVLVQLAPETRTPFGWAAFAWLDDETILYQHNEAMSDQTEAKAIFKTVDLGSKTISPVIEKTLPLTHDGGALYLESGKNEIIFVHKTRETREFVLDLEAGELRPRQQDEPLQMRDQAGTITVQAGGKTLFTGKHFAGQLLGLPSPSGKHFAYSLMTGREVRDRAQKSDLFVNIDAGPAQPIGETIYYRKPLAWIE